MRQHFSVRLVVLFVVVTLGIPVRAVLAQGNPFLGTWELNVAKSKYTPGPLPKSQSVVNEASGSNMKTTTKGVDAAGKPTATSFTATFDGKDFAVTGSPDYDTQSYKRIDANTLELTRKKGGKVVQTGTNVVAKDGRSRTITVTGVDAQGRKIHNIGVYDKK